jgi:S1-C subfamily serine protease
MVVIDVIVGGMIVAGVVCGWVVGVGRALSVAGFAAGIVLGSRLPLLVGEDLHSQSALVIALPAALLAGGLVAVLAERLAPAVARVLGDSPLVGGGVGALLVGASAAVAGWVLAPAVSQVRSVRGDVERSEILQRFNAVLTPAGPVRHDARASDRASSEGRRPTVAVPESRLLSHPAVKLADRNLVEITTTRCTDGFQGSGWIAGHGIVVTNAHVVTAAKRVFVVRGGQGASLPATVVWFDGIHDLALLRVALLRGAPGLRLADDTRPRTPGFSLGFVGDRKTIKRARLGITSSHVILPPLQLENRAGISLTMKERLVTIIRGISGPGGSGGPIVDDHGRVMATLFAGIPRSGFILAVPNRIVRSAMRRARGRVAVPACGDPPLKPTPRQSIAARNA